MSTFKGIIAEFPQIRIDYFRQQPDHKAPLACFLSHVHSDHLTGLESLRAPFVYCSAATREILLRLERYHYRANFARGILESRDVTYDKSMQRLAKPLPLETPTVIELGPGKNIQVTLFDANHCVGAVMFLIEGGGKAVLYTGDIRAEAWWVNSLVRNPVLVPYTLGNRRIDCMYLDTTFATKSEPYREFASKAEGIKELLSQVGKYPEDTIFYFHSWTFGYEDVWVALSTFLQSPIHLDPYRHRLYHSLSTTHNRDLRRACLGFDIKEAATLCGFKNGNHNQPGCLTADTDVRIHSCERGMGCPAIDGDPDAKIVHIIPIINRVKGVEIAEIGAGGGKGDMDQKEELDTGDAGEIAKLMELCAKEIEDEELLSKVQSLLQQAIDRGNGTIDLERDVHRDSQDSDDGLTLQSLISILSAHVERANDTKEKRNPTIRFPYSRHSSFAELCALVEAFRPKDVFPCTVDEANWNPNLGMRTLFGQFCSADVFRHDVEMTEVYESKRVNSNKRACSQAETEEETQTSEEHWGNTHSPKRIRREEPNIPTEIPSLPEITSAPAPSTVQTTTPGHTFLPQSSVPSPTHIPDSPPSLPLPTPGPPVPTSTPISTSPPLLSTTSNLTSTNPPNQEQEREHKKKRRSKRLTTRELAYKAALGIELSWHDYGGLICAKNAEEEEAEVEL